MSSDVTLSAAVRNNLLALQDTAAALATTQNRLATGKKVNSALDNPTNFFTASSLDARASDLTSLLDGVSNGVQTLQAADSGISGITSLVNQLQATARQALQASASFSSKAAISTGSITGLTASNLLGAASAGGATNAALAAGTAITAPVAAGHASAAGTSAINAPVAAGAPADGTAGAAVDTTASSSATNSLKINGITLTVDTLTADATANGGNNDGKISADEAASAINDAISAALTADPTGNAALAGVTVVNNSGTLTISNSSTGTGAQVAVDSTVGDAATFGFTADIATSGTGASGGVDASGGGVSFKVNNTTVSLSATGGTNGDGHYSAQDIADAINATTGITANATVTSGTLTLTSTGTAGASDAVTVDNFTGGADATDLGFAGATVSADGSASSGGIDGSAGGVSFEVNGQTVTLSATGGTNGDGRYSADDLATAINGAVTGVNATAAAGKLTITSTGTAGESDAVTLGSFSGTTAAALGFSSTNATGTVSYTGGATNGLAGKTLTLTGTDGVSQKTLTFGTGTGDISSLDDLNTAISSLNLQATVSTDGKLTITTTNGAGAENFSVDGGTATGTGNSFATTTVSTAVLGGDGQDARANFITQYNDLLGQIDSLATDSSYNGVNLLNNDDLTVTLNESGNSKLDIKGVNDSSAGLGLSSLGAADFQDSIAINKVLSTLDTSVATLRSQSSQFGSNLSIVQTRQDFTKSLVNVLQTGSNNLTSADSNEEGANLLALQTRQSLSTTALSLASQSDQNVLKLFG